MDVRSVRVLCVDDNELVPDAVERRLAREPGFTYVGSLSSADRLVSEVQRTDADLVLLDINMPGMDPFEALSRLKRERPGTVVLALSGSFRESDIDRMIAAGAQGYISKDDEPGAMVESMKRAMAGEVVFGPEVLRFFARSGSGTRPSLGN